MVFHLEIEGVPLCTWAHADSVNAVNFNYSRVKACTYENKIQAKKAAKKLDGYALGVTVVEGPCPESS